jgi:hypothetical protein
MLPPQVSRELTSAELEPEKSLKQSFLRVPRLLAERCFRDEFDQN